MHANPVALAFFDAAIESKGLGIMYSLRPWLIGVLSVLCATGTANATSFLSLNDNQGHFAAASGSADTLSLSVNDSSGPFAGSPWTVAFATGNNNTGVVGLPSISLDVTSTSSQAGILFGLFSIDDLTFGSAPHVFSLNSSILNLSNSAGVDWQVCVDGGNRLGAQTDCSGFHSASLGALTFAPTVQGTFSFTLMTRFTADGPATFNISSQATDPIPEPGTLALVGIALLGLGRVRRRAH